MDFKNFCIFMSVCAILTKTLYKTCIKSAKDTDQFEHFILYSNHKYIYFFIQFIVGPLIVLLTKSSLKNDIDNILYIHEVPEEFIIKFRYST